MGSWCRGFRRRMGVRGVEPRRRRSSWPAGAGIVVEAPAGPGDRVEHLAVAESQKPRRDRAARVSRVDHERRRRRDRWLPDPVRLYVARAGRIDSPWASDPHRALRSVRGMGHEPGDLPDPADAYGTTY